MSVRGPYRRHSLQFKIQVCSDIRSGKVGRREALKTHNLSANLMQMWLAVDAILRNDSMAYLGLARSNYKIHLYNQWLMFCNVAMERNNLLL
jgi:hypothetical protein